LRKEYFYEEGDAKKGAVVLLPDFETY